MNMCVCVDVCVCYYCFNGFIVELGVRMLYSFVNYVLFWLEFVNELLLNVDLKYIKIFF